MKITLPTLRTSHAITNEEATSLCQLALEQKDKEDYAGAQETMRRLWAGVGERPITEGLHPSIAAEVLLTAGVLTGWIGSKHHTKDAQETAKNLLTESHTYFESAGDVLKTAAARTEIAFCYWRQGQLNEARIMVREALEKLPTGGNTRARALLKLVAIECSAARYHEALTLLTDNAAMFGKLAHHTIKGGFHCETAIILRNLGKSESEMTTSRGRSANSKKRIRNSNALIIMSIVRTLRTMLV